ncbi:MAG: phosphoribosylglycinamide formyltransferase [Actinobacteria bacterium]|nr:phosphoribosylglycinamide formyltransferase [Actinomycetota bacterium]
MLKVVVLISGGGSNLKALLDAAAEPTYPARVVAVGSDTDAAGLDYAREAGIETFVVRPRDFENRDAWGEAFATQIREHLSKSSVEAPAHLDKLDGRGNELAERYLVVSAGLMRVLPAGFVREFSPALINTHPALLPLYPGAHAVRDALAAGATETGVTVHIIDEGVDTGPVLCQRAVSILAGESEDDLHERIKQIERPLLVDTVRDIATGALPLTSA